MWRGTRRLFVFSSVLSMASVLTLIACGGGGMNPPTPWSPQTPQFTRIRIPLSQTGVPISLPEIGTFPETITLPANNNHRAELSLIVSSYVPARMPAVAADMHADRPYVYLTLTSSQNVTLSGFPRFTITLPSSDLYSTSVKMGFYRPEKGWQHIGDFGLADNVWSFAGTTSPTALAAGTAYYAMPYGATP
jgi:hypothetical protein